MIFDQYTNFLDRWFFEIKKIGIDISGFNLDHLGYGVSSKEEYDEVKEEFLKISELLREPLVSKRRVGVFKFFHPLEYKGYSIGVVELIEPKEGETTTTGWEHAEFTIDFPFEKLREKYPNLPWDTNNINRPDFPRLKIKLANGLEIKFNHQPILK